MAMGRPKAALVLDPSYASSWKVSPIRVLFRRACAPGQDYLAECIGKTNREIARQVGPARSP